MSSFDHYFTEELRGKVQELTHRSTGDFVAELAEWLISSGRVETDESKMLRDRQVADYRSRAERADKEIKRQEVTARMFAQEAGDLRKELIALQERSEWTSR